MRFHLALGFHHKTQTHPVAGQLAGGQPNAKRSHVPQWCEPTAPVAQLLQALLCPGQVIGFLDAGAGEVLTQCGVLRGQGLCGVQRLGAHLAHVVDSH